MCSAEAHPFRGASSDAFHVINAQTHEVVYFRPFNFRATDSTRHAHAVQYASHPRWPWEKLRTDHPGEYERALAPAPDGDEWFHVGVVVARPKVTVFVEGAAQPSLTVNELGDLTAWFGWPLGGRELGRPLRQSARDADAVRHSAEQGTPAMTTGLLVSKPASGRNREHEKC